MILYGAVILVIFSIENEAKSFRKSNTAITGHKSDNRSINAGELARLINKINEAESEEVSRIGNKNDIQQNGRLLGLDLDYIGIRTSAENSVSNIVKTIQSKYDAIKTQPDDENEVRFHVIKNPHVLEQFKEDLVRKHVSTSSSSDDVSSDYDDFRMEKLIRRNAFFRLGSKRDSSENIYMRQNPKFGLRVGEENEFPRQRNRKHSRENDRDNNYGNENIKEKIVVTFKDKPDEYDEMKIRFDANRHKENNEAAKKDWDMITNKNTGDWERDKKKNNYKDDYKNNDRSNYDKHRNKDTQIYKKHTKDDWNKHNDDSWNNWKSKSKEKDETPRQEKRADDSWGKSQKKELARDSNERKPENDWNEKTEKKADIFKLTTNKASDWNRGSGSNKAYAPKISDYYNPRPRIHDSLDRGFKPFGRTSIPFVGKKGIYEEK